MKHGVPAALLVMALALTGGAARAALLTPDDILRRPLPTPDRRIAYGAGPSQKGELWLPRGAGRHPVVVILHGGCWLEPVGGLALMDRMADDLKRRGMAVWNLEYRRLGEAGGGYPGTFTDVGDGVDKLRDLARTYPIDLRHVVVLGHSAGGHLALWAAARGHLPKTSPLRRPDPLTLAGAVSLGGIADLAAYRDKGPTACRGPETIDRLVDTAHRPAPTAYADTSPAALTPIGTPLVVISGDLDPIVPKAFGQAYAAKAKAAGDRVQELTLSGAGHFELIDPRSAQWPAIVRTIEALAR